MQTNIEVAISAIAIAHGMNLRSYGYQISQWNDEHGSGWVELYAEIAELAVLSEQIADRASTSPDFEVVGFPGVYCYEVDEEFGRWLVAALLDNTIDGLHDRLAKRKLGQFAMEFFTRDGATLPHVTQIVKELTGYDHDIVAIQVIPFIDHGGEIEPQFEGPTESTTGWGMYYRLRDGTVRHVNDFPSERQAMDVAECSAKVHGVQIEAQPWRQA